MLTVRSTFWKNLRQEKLKKKNKVRSTSKKQNKISQWRFFVKIVRSTFWKRLRISSTVRSLFQKALRKKGQIRSAAANTQTFWNYDYNTGIHLWMSIIDNKPFWKSRWVSSKNSHRQTMSMSFIDKFLIDKSFFFSSTKKKILKKVNYIDFFRFINTHFH